MTSSPKSSHADWLSRSGYFREVVGYAEAVDLLNDPRMQSRFVKILENVGLTDGPVWEAAAASLLSLNGDEHKRLRSLVAERFTPRAVEPLRPGARATAQQLIAELTVPEPMRFRDRLRRALCHEDHQPVRRVSRRRSHRLLGGGEERRVGDEGP